LGHVIGFVDRKRVGIEGVEGALDSLLGGKNGYRDVSRDGRGDEILAFRGDVVEPRHGHSIRLTIDMRIQEITEDALDVVYADVTPRKAMAVVVRPETGEILAMANRPDFDRSVMKGNFRNHAVEALYEPGSTFKIVAIGGVLDRGLVSLSTRVFCHNGYLREPGLPSPLKDHHPYGELTVATVISKSSNIGTYKLASQLGKDSLCDYIRAFGFGKKTNIELTGELAGTVHPADRWSATSLSRIGMGYEVAVTPVQMVMAMAAVANDGVLLRPRIVAAVHDAAGRDVTGFRPEVISRPISSEAARQLRKALAGVTEEGGTGRKASVEGWSVAGKTGTSKRYDEDKKGYVEGSYVTSFVGYAPRDHPELAVIVVVDDPQGEKRYGGTVAAPVFAEIVGPSLEYLAIRGEIEGRETIVASSRHGTVGNEKSVQNNSR
jgi:cell division protein FtsI/penicillin-binding protein 2